MPEEAVQGSSVLRWERIQAARAQGLGKAIAGRVPSLATGVASLSSHLDAEPKMHRPWLRGEKSLGPEVLRCKLPPFVCWLRSSLSADFQLRKT